MLIEPFAETASAYTLCKPITASNEVGSEQACDTIAKEKNVSFCEVRDQRSIGTVEVYVPAANDIRRFRALVSPAGRENVVTGGLWRGARSCPACCFEPLSVLGPPA